MNNFDFIKRYVNMHTEVPIKEKETLRDSEIIDFNSKLLDLCNNQSLPYHERIKFGQIAFRNLIDFAENRMIVRGLCSENPDKELEDFILAFKEFILKLNETSMEMIFAIQEYDCDLDPFKSQGRLLSTVNQPIQLKYAGEAIKTYADRVAEFKNNDTFYSVSFNFTEDQSLPIVEMEDNDTEKNITINLSPYVYALYGFKLSDCPELEELASEAKTAAQWANSEDLMRHIQSGKNVLVHVPFDSYQIVVDYIHALAVDPSIVSITMTLYRTAENSAICNVLEEAAINHKLIHLYVEFGARGNERENIAIYERFKKYPNVHISSGCIGYKVHAKLFTAVDCEGNIYWHVGTGNYNEITAKIYTDLHYLGMNEINGLSVLAASIAICNNKPPEEMIPRDRIFTMIQEAARNQMDIMIKCNNLDDPQIIAELQHAADAGCSIRLIIRTTIGIEPYPGIHIQTIVGDYLEHERIYMISHPIDLDPTMEHVCCYIGSADLLFRNLSKRVEYLVRVRDIESIQQLMNIFNYNWKLGG